MKGGGDATAAAQALATAVGTAIATAYASASAKTTVQGDSLLLKTNICFKALENKTLGRSVPAISGASHP